MSISINSPIKDSGILNVSGNCDIKGAHTGHDLTLIIWDNSRPSKKDVTSSYQLSGPRLGDNGDWTGTISPIPPSDYTIEIDCAVGGDEESATTPVGS